MKPLEVRPRSPLFGRRPDRSSSRRQVALGDHSYTKVGSSFNFVRRLGKRRTLLYERAYKLAVRAPLL
jgi:hypothetical protein